jgi:hypothetical protein
MSTKSNLNSADNPDEGSDTHAFLSSRITSDTDAFLSSSICVILMANVSNFQAT